MKKTIPTQQKQSVIISIPVWGDEYIRLFLDISLPFYFSKNNLPYLQKQKKYNSRVIIHTFRKHFETFKESSSFINLESIINVEFRFIDEMNIIENQSSERQKQFNVFVECHKDVIKIGSEESSIILFFNADLIFSNNLFKNLFDYLDKGYRAICISAMRLNKNKSSKIILENSTFNYTGKELVELALDNLHPSFKNLNWQNKNVPSCLSILYWHLDDKNILLRSFHLHPLAIWPEKQVLLKNTIDDSFLFESCSKEKIKVIEDSDDFVVFELTDEKSNMLGQLVKYPFLYLVKWSANTLTSGHWGNIEYKLFFRTNNFSDSWKEIEHKSDLLYSRLKKMVIFYQLLKKTKVIYFLKALRAIYRFGKKVFNFVFRRILYIKQRV